MEKEFIKILITKYLTEVVVLELHQGYFLLKIRTLVKVINLPTFMLRRVWHDKL